MRWEDERYIRLYTRDTVGWRMLPWQSKALLPLLMRKVDRAGLLELDEHGASGLAELVELPAEIVDAGLAGLLKAKSVTLRDTTLLVPNFLEAQEAHSSDAQRKRDQRERARAQEKLAEFVTPCDAESQNGTESHAESQHVTPIRSVPSLAVPNQSEETLPHPSGSDFDLEAVFRLYPRRLGRKKGLQRLRTQITTREKYDALVTATRHYAEWVSESGTPPQYQKHFDTFASCWEDFVTKPAVGSATANKAASWQGKPVGMAPVGKGFTKGTHDRTKDV